MGAWGTGVFQNDIGEDIKSSYVNQLKMGKGDEDAIKNILTENEEYLSDPDDNIDFWLALSSVMYDYGRLTDYVKERAILVLKSDEDRRRWSEKEQNKRDKVLKLLEDKLNMPLPERKKVSVLKRIETDWKRNDIYFAEVKSICAGDIDGYFVFCVTDTAVYDARIPGLGDTMPVTYLKYMECIPEDIREIDDIPFLIRYKVSDETYNQFFWYHEGFKKIKSKFIYGGNFDFKRPGSEPVLNHRYLLKILTLFSGIEKYLN